MEILWRSSIRRKNELSGANSQLGHSGGRRRPDVCPQLRLAHCKPGNGQNDSHSGESASSLRQYLGDSSSSERASRVYITPETVL